MPSSPRCEQVGSPSLCWQPSGVWEARERTVIICIYFSFVGTSLRRVVDLWRRLVRATRTSSAWRDRSSLSRRMLLATCLPAIAVWRQITTRRSQVSLPLPFTKYSIPLFVWPHSLMLFWVILIVLFLAFRRNRAPQSIVSESANSTEFMEWVQSMGTLLSIPLSNSYDRSDAYHQLHRNGSR